MSGQRQVEIRWSRHSSAYVLVDHGAPADAEALLDRAGQGVDEMRRVAELNDFDVVRVVTRPDAEISALEESLTSSIVPIMTALANAIGPEESAAMLRRIVARFAVEMRQNSAPGRRCALWYSRFGISEFDICDSEDEAVEEAVLESQGDESGFRGTLLGIQHADGRLVPASEWMAYRQACEDYRRRQEEAWERRKSEPKREPVDHIPDPFTGLPAAVWNDEVPAWLGAGRPEAGPRA